MGDIKVTYADGHTEMWTKGALCGDPYVSSAGDVSWIHSTKNDDRYTHRAPDTVHVRLRSGDTKELKPNDAFIETWAFASNDSEVVIKSRGDHGPAAPAARDQPVRLFEGFVHAPARGQVTQIRDSHQRRGPGRRRGKSLD